MIAEPRRCCRCDQIGHTADACVFFPNERDDHPDAKLGDTTPHLQHTQILLTVEGQVIERNRRLPGWWNGQELDISVDGIWFVLGRASGKGCNCLTDTLQPNLPTFVCDVALVRAELERRHARSPTAILPLDYLDLAMYWADIIDIIGEQHSCQSTEPFFTISCLLHRYVLDWTWRSSSARRTSKRQANIIYCARKSESFRTIAT